MMTTATPLRRQQLMLCILSLLVAAPLLAISITGEGKKLPLRDEPRRAPMVRPANAVNVTVFHVVDTKYQKRLGPEREWPINMNTADLGGDMYFDLGWGQLEVLECALPLNYSRSRLVKVNCVENAEVWDRSHLAIAQLTLEVVRAVASWLLFCCWKSLFEMHGTGKHIVTVHVANTGQSLHVGRQLRLIPWVRCDGTQPDDGLSLPAAWAERQLQQLLPTRCGPPKSHRPQRHWLWNLGARPPHARAPAQLDKH
jgi:hypothetical protein